uniref:Na(+)/H(+) exchange regulatory cofactor NHE-RF n=1 Tax=Amphiprion percula TaxID=161767 RepID=A0A3P8T2S6_AMPPE
MESELRPRLCFLTKGERGYGFHLHGERNRGGQFIRKVEPGSSADLAGLRPGDRVVEVNGENVENETHHQVSCDTMNHFFFFFLDDKYVRGKDVPREAHKLSQVQTMSSIPVRPLFCCLRRRRRGLLNGSPTGELLPRLCHLIKGENGYGFNLHSDKTKGGQFVRAVDPNSAAESAGIRAGDRVVEVNGASTEGLRHSEVVALIRTGGGEVRLLVVDPETDELFQRLGITPTASHTKESVPPTPSPTTELPAAEPPLINVTLTNSPISRSSPKPRTNGSSASQSSRSSTTQSEISSSDMSIQVPDEDERRVSDPFMDSGLRLSPTAAEAKQKALASRNKKRAPSMDWSKKQEIFSNF